MAQHATAADSDPSSWSDGVLFKPIIDDIGYIHDTHNLVKSKKTLPNCTGFEWDQGKDILHLKTLTARFAVTI